MKTYPVFEMDEFIKHEINRKKNGTLLSLAPKIIGGFSVSSDRVYQSNANELKFLVMPDPASYPLNLSEPLVRPVVPDTHITYLDHMLLFIKDHKDQMTKGSVHGGFSLNANIVTQLEVLQIMMSTFYLKRNWCIIGTKFRNTIYLCMAKPILWGLSTRPLRDMKKCHRWEKKLTQLMYSDTPEGQSEVSSQCGEFYGVFECDIDGLTVVYGSSMGAQYGKPDEVRNKSLSKFTECKVILPHIGLNSNVRYRPDALNALAWWAECSLKGVEEIYVSRPKFTGVVEYLEKCSVASLVQENITDWCSHRCTSFMGFTLRHICNIIKLENPNTVYQFEFISNPGALTCSVSEQRNEQTFISDWYRSLLEANNPEPK